VHASTGPAGLTERHEVEIVLLLASPLHRYDGRPADGPLPLPDGGVAEEREQIEICAQLGVVGDRFFNAPAHRGATVTVMAAEAVERLVEELGLDAVPDLAAPRRNVMLRGFDVDSLRRRRFALQSIGGDGAEPVLLQGGRPANPCAWMDVTLAPGAFRALRGRGGVRCEPLSDGVLTLGPAVLWT
jgi:MOSC domain-containing protein YiiM